MILARRGADPLCLVLSSTPDRHGGDKPLQRRLFVLTMTILYCSFIAGYQIAIVCAFALFLQRERIVLEMIGELECVSKYVR